MTNISEIIQFLISKQNEYPRELRYKVLKWITENYFEIYQKQNQSLRLCEEFLTNNIERRTIERISQFIVGERDWRSSIKTFQESYKEFALRRGSLAGSQKKYDETEKEAEEGFEQEEMEPNSPRSTHTFSELDQSQAKKEAKEVFEQETMKLRGAAYCFIQENFEEVKKEKRKLPRRFLMGMIATMLPNLNKNKSLSLNKDQENEEAKQGGIGENDEKENVKNGQARGRKRKEPIQKENEASEKPELKKMKKCENCRKEI